MFKFNYFDEKLSIGFVALSAGRLIQVISNALVGIFLPIFLFQKLSNSLSGVLIFFGLTWIVYGLFLPLGVQFLNRFGLRRALQASIFFDALTYVCLFYFDKAPYLFLVLAGISRTLNMLLFWIPYHVDFAKFTTKKNRGREYSMILAIATIFGIIMPIISGSLITNFGFKFIFALEIIATMFELIPFMMLPRTHESFSWSFRETWKHYLAPRNRRLILAHMGSGAENIVSLLIWPIFIFMLLKGEYLKVGAISTLISAATVILQLAVGKWTDKLNKRKIIRAGSLLYSFGWVIKTLIATAFQIFVIGVYHSFMDVIMRTPFDSLNYEIAADQGHYVDEYTVVKEMAVQFGRVIMIIAVVTLLWNGFALKWVFALAAIASLAFNLLPDEEMLDIHEKMALRKVAGEEV